MATLRGIQIDAPPDFAANLDLYVSGESVMNRMFIDTLFVIALINRRDYYLQQALALAGQFEGHPILVTDAVLLEIGNALARSYKQEAVEIIEQFLAAEEVDVVYLTPQLFAQGLALYKSHQDRFYFLLV